MGYNLLESRRRFRPARLSADHPQTAEKKSSSCDSHRQTSPLSFVRSPPHFASPSFVRNAHPRNSRPDAGSSVVQHITRGPPCVHYPGASRNSMCIVLDVHRGGAVCVSVARKNASMLRGRSFPADPSSTLEDLTAAAQRLPARSNSVLHLYFRRRSPHATLPNIL